MKTKTVLSVLLAAAVAGALLVQPGLASAKGKKKSGPQIVGTDDAGDWGANVDANLAPLGDVSGQELVEASIAMADAKTVNFIIKLNSLPPSGGLPEVSRYNWDIMVDGDQFQLTGGFTEYIRGICNPNVTNSCPPPRDPGSAPFFIRQGPCNVGAACEEVGLVHATFDAAAATITVPVTLDIIKAKPGSKITPGASAYGASIYATHQANVSNAALPHDTMTVTGTFVVSSGKKG
ncbi:MAG TPA: hypothetical protein VJ927_03310 [Actinomycetota bacterium]|nr:hypothetical protein [Actinomycetota bacterium]